VIYRPLEPIRPEMYSCEGIDELPGDPHAVRCLAHAAFEYVTDAELAPDLLHVHGAALIGEARVASDDDELSKAGERRDDLLDDPVREILLLRVAGHVLEGQHRNRWLVGERERLPCCGRGLAACDAEYTHRPLDVLQLVLAEIVRSEWDLASHLVPS